MYALYQIETELVRLKWQLAALRVQRAMRRHVLALRAYNPEQPRDEVGRWTDEGGGQVMPSGTDTENGRDIDSGSPPSGDRSFQVAVDIRSFTKHGINQAISRSISPSAIRDVVINPIQILPQANGTTRYIGAGAVVVLSPGGRVITVWGR